MKTLFVIINALVLLSGCNISSDPKSVQYYLAHKDEAAVRVANCRSSGENSQDCKNASEAAAMSIMSPLGGTTKRVQSIAEIEAEKKAQEATNGPQK